jgi:hypothetical protein
MNTMPDPRPLPGTRRCAASSLVELLISGVILIIVVVPVGLMMSGSSGTVHRVDLQREVRGIVEHVIERAEAQDFGVLYDNFGIRPDAAGRIAQGLEKNGANPLEIDPDVLRRMQELGLAATLTFRFFTKQQVQVRPDNNLRTQSGLLWLQGGVLGLRVRGGARSGLLGRYEVDETLERTVYCPLILGRPGLLLNQCPAVDPSKKAKFEGLGIP